MLSATSQYWVAMWWGTQTNSAEIGIWASNDGPATTDNQVFNASFGYASHGEHQWGVVVE